MKLLDVFTYIPFFNIPKIIGGVRLREVTADTADGVGASFLERVQMCLEDGGAYFEHMRK